MIKANQAELYQKLLTTYAFGGKTHQERMVAVERLVDENNGDWLRRHRKRKQSLNELEQFLKKKFADAPIN